MRCVDPGRWATAVSSGVFAVAIAVAVFPAGLRAQSLAPSAGSASTPTCAANEAEQTRYLRERNLRLPICPVVRPALRLVPLPLSTVSPVTITTPTLAPPAITIAPALTVPPAAAGVPAVASTASAPGGSSGSVPACVATEAAQTRYERASGIRPPLCGSETVVGSPLAPARAPAPAAAAGDTGGAPGSARTAGSGGSGGESSAPAAAPAASSGGAASGGAASGGAGGGSIGGGGPVSGGGASGGDASANPVTPQAAAPVQGAGAAPRPAREPDQLVIYWPDGATLGPLLARLQREFGLSPVQRTELGSLGGVVLLFKTAPGSGDAAGASSLDGLRTRLRAALPEVAVDFNALYYTEAGPRQYFAEHLQLPAGAGPALPIGMVDTEVGEIAALKDARLTRKSFLSAGEVAASDAHGTAVASLIAGRDPARQFSGAAPGAAVFSAAIMRRIGEHDGTSTLLLAQALDWLLAQRVRVINLSLGGPGDALMARLIDKLTHAPGVLVVAAAGNAGPDGPPSYPAAYPGVLAVTATNAADEVYGRANRGAYVGLAAPGEDLWVPDAGAGRYVSGTSFAAALVSGLAGRVLARAPGLGSSALRKHLCDSARDLGAPGNDPVYGCGLVRAAAALDAGVLGELAKKN